MDGTKFQDKFIAFVDILGFKKFVSASEKGIGMSLSEILDILNDLGTPEDKKQYVKYGPIICPESSYAQKDLNFRITQISDCVVVSSEVSPAGLINLVHHCWSAVFKLLNKGILCRGYITKGSVFHTDTQFIGSGYQYAVSKEKAVTAFIRKGEKEGTPYVEIDQIVCDYVKDCGDLCVKEMFSRFVIADSTVTALFPIKRLAHSFIIGGSGSTFEPKKEKENNENIRTAIKNIKERVISFVDYNDPDIVQKAEHYIEALTSQLAVCDKTAEMIDILNCPYP